MEVAVGFGLGEAGRTAGGPRVTLVGELHRIGGRLPSHALLVEPRAGACAGVVGRPYRRRLDGAEVVGRAAGILDPVQDFGNVEVGRRKSEREVARIVGGYTNNSIRHTTDIRDGRGISKIRHTTDIRGERGIKKRELEVARIVGRYTTDNIRHTIGIRTRDGVMNYILRILHFLGNPLERGVRQA